jgi:hypothetical protein
MFVKSKMFKVKNWLVKKYPWANSSSPHRDLLFNFFVFFPFSLFLCVCRFILCNFLSLFSFASPFLLFHSYLQFKFLSFFFSLFLSACLCYFLFLFSFTSTLYYFFHLFNSNVCLSFLFLFVSVTYSL